MRNAARKAVTEPAFTRRPQAIVEVAWHLWWKTRPATDGVDDIVQREVSREAWASPWTGWVLR